MNYELTGLNEGEIDKKKLLIIGVFLASLFIILLIVIIILFATSSKDGDEVNSNPKEILDKLYLWYIRFK